MGLISNIKKTLSLKTQIADLEQKLSQLSADIENKENLRTQIINDATREATLSLDALKRELDDQQALKERVIAEALMASQSQRTEIERIITEHAEKLEKIKEEIAATVAEHEALNEKFETDKVKAEKQSAKLKILSAQYRAIQKFANTYATEEKIKHDLDKIMTALAEIDAENLLSPTTELELHSMEIPDLRKKMRAIQKQITDTLDRYKERYTTKANMAIYSLMVVALRAELQNVLFAMRYDKLDKSIENIKTITQKYLAIAAEGNQGIAPTMVKFIGEIEELFIECVKVEYEYYVRKERIKEEQRALRAQMKQEAEERKALEQQQKQVAQEESKYAAELEKLKAQMAEADAEKSRQFEERIAELQNQLEKVAEKKEEITRLQHGKAGYVYIISNLGAFGDQVFKIGMTRRLEPQERIDELGDASVPFPFDVHSFIFSDDAVGLEATLHKTLHERRLNKVNLRKEFFKSTVEELEILVNELDPTAVFTKTMLAEQFRQSESMAYVLDNDDDSEDNADEDGDMDDEIE